jgi:hypothetical protein
MGPGHGRPRTLLATAGRTPRARCLTRSQPLPLAGTCTPAAPVYLPAVIPPSVQGHCPGPPLCRPLCGCARLTSSSAVLPACGLLIGVPSCESARRHDARRMGEPCLPTRSAAGARPAGDLRSVRKLPTTHPRHAPNRGIPPACIVQDAVLMGVRLSEPSERPEGFLLSVSQRPRRRLRGRHAAGRPARKQRHDALAQARKQGLTRGG